jgi:hypothetical protein
MPSLKVSVQNRFRRDIADRLDLLLRNEKQARQRAAQFATQETQDAFRYLRPHDATRRPGRSFSTGGRFPSFLRWKATAEGVAFDAQQANRQVPYWIIQEIGTGQSARIRRAGESVSQGRPTREEAAVRSPRIPSQRGRLISPGLAFGTREGGTYTPPGAATGQQLYLRSRLSGSNLSFVDQGRRQQQHQLVIRREIEGQHFVQKGGKEGFRQYRTSVLAAARQAFAGKRFQP